MKICIIGSSCSGKSTLAHHLSQKLSLQTLHLDQIFFEKMSQWVSRPLEDFVQEHNQFVYKDSWIVEGNYYVCMPNRFARATTVIILQINFLRCLLNWLRRICQKNGPRFGMLEGAQDHLNWPLFLHIIKYMFRLKKYKNLIENYPHLRVIKLHSYVQIDDFLENAVERV